MDRQESGVSPHQLPPPAGWGLLLGVHSLAILTPPMRVQSETQDASAVGEPSVGDLKGNGGDASGTPIAFLQTLNQKHLTVESHNKYPSIHSISIGCLALF